MCEWLVHVFIALQLIATIIEAIVIAYALHEAFEEDIRDWWKMQHKRFHHRLTKA